MAGSAFAAIPLKADTGSWHAQGSGDSRVVMTTPNFQPEAATANISLSDRFNAVGVQM